ncbi:hypothetical protein N7450_011591 [Penicillium hetheringtonii]|uniref:Uncharacterized protein n=1 Tax=Penicillium hetheringtonii TaxID=911720 RepID=A0AAD6GNE6_9EURO|nr:hypothetical protein N7450_011591 [Penicillium hetheringtonii]
MGSLSQTPQNYGYEKGIFEVKLRDDFDTLDEDGKKLAMREWSQVKLAKAYKISILLEDKPAHVVMNVPRVFRELFLRCGEVSEIGVLPLRACLIELFQNWSDLGFSGEYALSFTQEQALAQECLDTDAERWVASALDANEKRTQNEQLLAIYIENVAGEKSAEEARAIWPFRSRQKRILEAVITFFPSIGKPKDQLTEAMAKNDYRAQQSSTRIVLLVTFNALSAN